MTEQRRLPILIDDPVSVAWHEEADVLVVGYGGAGVCAALEAREHNAEVTAIDRFEGGGATAISGGGIYAGGARFQEVVGYQDSPAVACWWS